MEVRMETVGDCSVLKLAGRLDGLGAGKFRQATGALHNVQTKAVVVDLGETTALLAAGADAIVRLAQQHGEKGIGVAVVRCSPEAARLMHAVGMTAFVPVFASLAEAQAHFVTSNRRP